MFVIFDNLLRSEKTRAIKEIISKSEPRQELYFQTFLALLISSVGLIYNNLPVIIGSMILGPLVYPLLSVSLGYQTKSKKLVFKSLKTIFNYTVGGIIVSALIGLCFRSFDIEDGGYYKSLEFNGSSYLIAIFAGAMAAFGVSKKNVNDEITGIAISVALVPPLAAIGISIARWDIDILTQASLVYFASITLISLSAWFIFSRMNFEQEKAEVNKTVKDEEEKSKKEADNQK